MGGANPASSSSSSNADPAASELPNMLPRGYQWEPPCDPNHPRQLLGWRVQAIFPTGPRQEDAWHDGFVFEVQQHREEGVTTYSLRIFYPFDLEDEFVNGWEAEDKDFCFIKANTKASGGSKVDARERERAVSGAASAPWLGLRATGGGSRGECVCVCGGS